MDLAKSTYYYELSKADVVAMKNENLMEEISKIFSCHKGRYGVRRVHQELVNRGHKVNHKRVQRLMHSIINRDFSTTAPLQKWTADVSQSKLEKSMVLFSPCLEKEIVMTTASWKHFTDPGKNKMDASC